MKVVFQRPTALTERQTHYCPGCTHGIIHRLVEEAIDELGVLDKAVGVASVGCSVLAYEYFNCDMQQAARGRAPAVATGIKRSIPTTSSSLTRGRRPGFHRYGGNRPRRSPRRKITSYLSTTLFTA